MADLEDQTSNYYDQLGLPPSASVQDIRRAYRDLSKLYHPDTTNLPEATAKEKFQTLNEAYATLSSPERRLAYDRKIHYSRISVIQPPANFNRSTTSRSAFRSSHLYLDPTDRPLSAGEIFALFILGLTFIACFILVIMLGLTRGDAALSAFISHSDAKIEQISRDQIKMETSAVDFSSTPPVMHQVDTTLKLSAPSDSETVTLSTLSTEVDRVTENDVQVVQG